MTDILHYNGTEPEEKRKIEIEQEAWRSVNALFESKENEFLRSIEQKDNLIREQERELEEMKKEIEKLRKNN